MYNLQFSTRPEQTARMIVVLAILLAPSGCGARGRCDKQREYITSGDKDVLRALVYDNAVSKFTTCQRTMSVHEH